ncbi:MAG TPA: TetR/AcrR family transcriptional regulator [Gemmatimonadaceae bacterium]|nr:TetR/AcrR family transcriptional regulator [Gemmatimonadaceae bacterium]
MTTRSPGRPRSEEAHAAILDASIALIREMGYDAVTMEAIAARAGVGKATVYRRWTSKELLVTEAVGRIVSTIPVPDTGSAEGDVLVFMRAATSMYRDPATSALLSGLVAAMARSERVAGAVRMGFVARWREGVRLVLRRGVARGELRADVDVELALDVLAGPAFYRYLMLGVAIDDRFTRAVVSTVLRGLASAR